jgi:glutamate 5-kinase
VARGAHLAGAGALVLLSDIDGLCYADPRKSAAKFIAEITGRADPDSVMAEVTTR